MFTFVDGAVAVILLGSAGLAFMRGFVHEVLSIAAWVGAVFVAVTGFAHVQPWFRSQVGVEWAADTLAAGALFLVALLIFSLVTKAVANRVKRSALNSVDSSLGFVFGLARGAVVVCLAHMVLVWAIEPEEPPAWLANAKTRPWMERGDHLLQALKPEGFGRDAKKAEERTATGNLDEDSRRGEDLAKSMPMPKPAFAPAEDGKGARGYDKAQRQEMNRLFQGNQR